MAKSKKFGTFAGVFTPSVLTILGVIMYMRLGWVVGEAGLYAAIGIILIAHIISITTGLSISSIATDKKIKTGGIYYILSRSLGLPMGGAIGITLFIGTALSIALYIVGFSESFLGIQAISDFLGLEADIYGIRIIGSIILLILAIIAFISTSLAIKSQFVVLGAIAISIVSIVAGFFFGSETAIQTNFTASATGHVSMITIFAIFFPAVTGFTAGVAMSGDLKDPKKSIPRGTLLSILTGLIVYLALAVGFAYFVDRDLLINNTNFISKIAYWAWPVVIGIWGATLSSALGGILGAPRIMQAISKDKIMPKLFGKGYGESNEPRNALIFTFFLAEMGVLMGELDAIAEVVSMFYIAAYGFINLAFALESWANTDFRPTFKISRWVGIIGFIASFGVMLQLNPAAMFAAFVIMWFIYFILKRRELKSDFGDVWSSVWSSIVRTSLNKLSKKQVAVESWSPNILLFSGGTVNRPHLIEFGKQLVGKYGFLSNFDLVETKEGGDLVISRQNQIVKDEDSILNQGFFTRRQSCVDIYSGIEQIASNYGFAGVEPNTVFLGWARNSKNPKRFIQMLDNIQKLDLNIVMMDFDQVREFGEYKQIDIWWRGGGQNGNLSLQLAKFILQSEKWANASIRLLVVNPINEKHKQIYRQAETILSNIRMTAEIKVINNQIDKRSFYDIVQIESVNSDLIFMGIEKVQEDQFEAFTTRMNELCLSIGTVVLSSASTHFRDLKVGLEEKNLFSDNKLDFQIDLQHSINEDELTFPPFEKLEEANKIVLQQLLDQNTLVKKKFLEPIMKSEDGLIFEVKNLLNHSIDSFEKLDLITIPEHKTKRINQIHSKFLVDLVELLDQFQKVHLNEEKKIFDEFIRHDISSITNLHSHLPLSINLTYNITNLASQKDDTFDVRWYKRWNRFKSKFGKKTFSYKLHYRNLLIQHALPYSIEQLKSFLQIIGIQGTHNIVNLRRFVSDIDLIFQEAKNEIKKPDIVSQLFIDKFNIRFEEFDKAIKLNNKEILSTLDQKALNNIRYINDLTSKVDANSMVDDEFNNRKALTKLPYNFDNTPYYRKRNQHLLFNNVTLNLHIINFGNKLKQIATEIEQTIDKNIHSGMMQNYDLYINFLNEFLSKLKKNEKPIFDFDNEQLNKGIDQNYSDRLINLGIQRLKGVINQFPSTIELLTEESENLLVTEQFTELESMKISGANLLDYMVQNHFNGSVKAILDEIPGISVDFYNRLIDQYRLISYSLNADESGNIKSDILQKDKDSLIKMIESELENLENEKQEIKKLNQNFQLRIEERLQYALNSIAIYPFIQAAGNLKHYIKKQKSQDKINKFRILTEKTKKWMQYQFAQLWYRQSQGIILTKELIENDEKSIQQGQEIRKLFRSLYSSKEIFDKIPFYYRQLFLRRHNFMKELWVGRNNEMNAAQQCISDHHNGVPGGIMITGEPYSGKSFFAQMVAIEYDKGRIVNTIIPPVEGSIDVKSFNQHIESSLNINISFEEYLDQNNKEVIIFEDLELWWEKQADGNAVIKHIHQLIRKYSHKMLFISTINIHTYKLVNQVNSIDSNYIDIIVLKAMDAKEINQMIMKRHTTSGLTFKLSKKHQDQFHTWDYAKLFNRYFNFSYGIPGVAIRAWVNNIEDIEDKTIDIKLPNNYNNDAFVDYSAEQNWQLLLFVLHKNMSIEKYSRLANIDKHAAFLEIENLMRKGLVYKTSDNVIRLNILMQHLIIQHLQKIKLL